MRIAARPWLFCTLAIAAAVAGAPMRARAGGLELLPGGTVSVMRGGAVAARPEDATGMLHNPAGLAYLSEDQITFDLDFGLREMCVDPYGYYGWGVYDNDVSSDFGDPRAVELDDDSQPIVGATYATTPLPKVCNSGEQFPVPNLAWVGKLSEDLALGVGFVAPTIVTGNQYGGRDGTISVDGRALPTPTRYVLIDQTAEVAFAPSAAVAYRLIPQLSLGVNVTVLMLRAKSRAIQNATSGTQPALDWLADLEAEDFFLPSVTVSAHVRPFRGLDATASLRWVDDLDGHGKASYETNTFHQLADGGSVPYRNDSIKLSTVRVGLPWAVTLGVRYGAPLPERPADEKKRSGELNLGDPLDTELWDVEVDGTYNLNARGSENRVKVGGDVRIITRTADGGGDLTAVTAKDLEEVSLDRQLEDSIALRLGGSFSLLPRRFAVHGGVFYENRGVDPAYANIDSFAFARVGFGLGVMWRVGVFDLTAAYGHIFQQTMRITVPEHDANGFDQRVGGEFDVDGTRIGGYVLEDPDAPSPSDADAVAKQEQTSALPKEKPGPRIINAGEYTASFNIISVGAVYHF